MSIYYQEKWDALEAEINRRGADGSAVVAAIKDLYSVYNTELIVWLAKLYDPKYGGFYYSNSSRDNESVEYLGNTYKLLPDIESTNQATNFLMAHGIIKDYMEIPEKMREQMFKFVNERLDPETGFFYHPQWTRELENSRPSRIGRDLMWSESMAEKFGWKYSYPTANERLSVKETDTASVDRIPEYLKTEEKFLEYLKSLDFDNRAYFYGNEVVAQINTIISSGFADIVVEYMNSVQNPETGLWGKQGGYDAINAYLKISGIYTNTGRVIPNTDKAVLSIIKCLTTDEPVETVCYQYNTWYSLQNILGNLRTLGGEEGNKAADEIVLTLLKMAPEAIKATKEKVLVFKKEDNSFSYAPNETACTSQGMPVALHHANEGDVNASVISSSGIIQHMFAALELTEFAIPTFGPDAYKIFLDNLNL